MHPPMQSVEILRTLDTPKLLQGLYSAKLATNAALKTQYAHVSAAIMDG